MHPNRTPARRTSPWRLRFIVTLVQILLFATGVHAEPDAAESPPGAGAELATSEPATLPPNPSSSRPATVAPPTAPAPAKNDESSWKFGYHGFLRAPLR